MNIMLRRLEIALQPDGWRGNVEDAVEQEMREEDARAQALKAVAYLEEPSREFVLETLSVRSDPIAGGSVQGGEEKSVQSGKSEGGGEDWTSLPVQQFARDEEEKSVVSIPGSNASPGMGLDQPESFISALTHK